MSNDGQMELPEGTHKKMFSQETLDGAKAAKEIVDIIKRGEATLEESLFRRDFLPILISSEPITEELEGLFNQAWIAVAGSLQSAISITRNKVYAYTVPPILSAYGVTLTGYEEAGSAGIRSAIEMVRLYTRDGATQEQQVALLEEAVFSKLKKVQIDPIRAEQWRTVLIENGIELSSTPEVASASVGDKLDGFIEPGEEL